jgi:hypothetical protein
MLCKQKRQEAGMEASMMSQRVGWNMSTAGLHVRARQEDVPRYRGTHEQQGHDFLVEKGALWRIHNLQIDPYPSDHGSAGGSV